MELYLERGFERTTVAEIAERAGLTERTFFRHFADKPEVLFSGSAELQELLVSYVDEAPATATPIQAITGALDQAATVIFEERRDFARQRKAIIMANNELRERELIKLATLALAMAGALRRRGVPDPAASLAAEAGIAVFKIAFQSWLDGSSERTLAEIIQESADELQRVTAERSLSEQTVVRGYEAHLVTMVVAAGHLTRAAADEYLATATADSIFRLAIYRLPI